jgi:hypothetical protein
MQGEHKTANVRTRRGISTVARGLSMASFVFWAHAAHAAPLSESLTGSAKTDYEAGRILYADGDYAGAALKWDVAYKTSRDARLLWNVAAARKAERKYAEVDRLVKQYLREAAELSEADRAEAQQLLATIQAFLADVTLQASETGAQVSIDGVVVGATPIAEPLRLDIGQHVITVSKPGFERVELKQQVTGNTTLTVSLVPQLHEGKLRIISPAESTVKVDGKKVTSGTWEGVLASGPHRVEVSAPGKLPFTTDAQISDDQSEVLRVSLQDKDPLAASRSPDLSERSSESSHGWIWVTLGVLLIAGAGAGAWYYYNKGDKVDPVPATNGNLDTVFLRTSF